MKKLPKPKPDIDTAREQLAVEIGTINAMQGLLTLWSDAVDRRQLELDIERFQIAEKRAALRVRSRRVASLKRQLGGSFELLRTIK
jgi:hypothetical protein